MTLISNQYTIPSVPHNNIWIRKEDEELWAAISSKAEWLHSQLNTASIPSNEVIMVSESTPTVEEASVPDKQKERTKIEDTEWKFCKHNTVVGMCKFGCKK